MLSENDLRASRLVSLLTSRPLTSTPGVQASPETPPPLPIAAAHHPAHLHSLSLPLFPPSRPSHLQEKDGQGEDAEPSTPHSISERLVAIEKAYATLQDALIGARSIHAQLQQRLQKAKSQEASHPSTSSRKKGPVKSNNGLQLDATLWDRRGSNSIDFKVRQRHYQTVARSRSSCLYDCHPLHHRAYDASWLWLGSHRKSPTRP